MAARSSSSLSSLDPARNLHCLGTVIRLRIAMDGTDAVTVKLSELLKHPDDLDKISALKAEFTRKKAGVDGQLRLALQEQLSTTQSGVTSVGDGVSAVDTLK